MLGRGEADEGAIITFEEAGDSEIGVIRIGEGRSESVKKVPVGVFASKTSSVGFQREAK